MRMGGHHGPLSDIFSILEQYFLKYIISQFMHFSVNGTRPAKINSNSLTSPNLFFGFHHQEKQFITLIRITDLSGALPPLLSCTIHRNFLQAVLRIWDCLFHEGGLILLRIAVTLLEEMVPLLVKCAGAADVLHVFGNIGTTPIANDCHRLLQV